MDVLKFKDLKYPKILCVSGGRAWGDVGKREQLKEPSANGHMVQQNYGQWIQGATDIHTISVYQMTHYFVQPHYITELDYYEIFAILNTRITALLKLIQIICETILVGQVRLDSSVELGWVTRPLRMLGWCKLDLVRETNSHQTNLTQPHDQEIFLNVVWQLMFVIRIKTKKKFN